MTSASSRRRLRCMRIAHRRMMQKKRRGIASSAVFFRTGKRVDVIVIAPHVFSFHYQKTRTDLLRFLYQVESAIILRKRLHIDFSKTRAMAPGATLYFWASLYRLRKFLEQTIVTCTFPHEEIIEQVLEQVMILKLLGKKSRKIISHESVIHWKTATGTAVEGQKIQPFVDATNETLTDGVSRNPLAVALSEAMTNCVHHAYPDSDRTKPVKANQEPRWWMFLEDKEDSISVAFLDLGIGIPSSMRNKHQDAVAALINSVRFPGIKDADLIRTSFHVGKTRTRKGHRGKGMRQLKKVLDRQPEGKLYVYSGYGCYGYVSQNEDASLMKTFSDSFKGTLYTWHMPLKNNENNVQK